jgi:hypothetical protein
MSQIVSEHYGCNSSRMAIILKTAVSICLEAHIRTIVVLTGGKLIEIYFLHLLYAIYYSVIMHLRKGRKVNILLLGDMNPGPILSR